MNVRRLAAIVGGLLLVACGGDTDEEPPDAPGIDATPSIDGALADAAAADAQPPDAAAVDAAEESDAPVPDAPPPVDAPVDAFMGTGLGASLTSFELWASCMGGGADPVNGSFTVTYANGGSTPASADIITVSLNWADGSKWSFTATPVNSGTIPPGGSASVTHNKVPGSGSGTADPCGQCDQDWTLSVTWTGGDGGLADELGPLPSMCVY